MTLMDSILTLAGPEIRKLMREELKATRGRRLIKGLSQELVVIPNIELTPQIF